MTDTTITLRAKGRRTYSINSCGVCINPDTILDFKRGKITIKVTYAYRNGDMYGARIETDLVSTSMGCAKRSKEHILQFIADNIGEHTGWRSIADRDWVLKNIDNLF